ncbi:MAG TPA: tetratricopeptide repeat protein [Ktedonobacteraceae bacterium]|nr:tetratricopeptide repeat protein [Ktedonobacteraceae bacterium]
MSDTHHDQLGDNSMLPPQPGPGESLSEAWATQADSLLRQGSYEQAIKAYRQVLKHDPIAVRSQMNLGFALQQIHAYAEAVEVYAAAIDYLPSTVIFDMGRFQEILDTCNKWIHQERHAIKAYETRARILMHLKRYQPALALYRQMLHLEVYHPGRYQDIGDALVGLQSYRKALWAYNCELADWPEAVERALERGIHPRSFEFYHTMLRAALSKASTLNQLHRYREAISTCDRIIHLDCQCILQRIRNDPQYQRSPLYRDILVACESWLRLTPDLKRATIEGTEDIPRACDQALFQHQDCIEAYLSKGLAQHRLHQREEALATYEQAQLLHPYNKAVKKNLQIMRTHLARLPES